MNTLNSVRAKYLSGTALTKPSFFDPGEVLVVDTECYPNFWSIGFRRLSDGKTLVIEHSVRKPATDEQRARIRNLMMSNLIITYNGVGYDLPMIWKMIGGATNAELKQANDRIIVGKMKPWHAKEVLGVEVPRDCFIRKDGTRSDGIWHIDLKEPQPNAFASLKTLAGRQHAQKMQDLPYEPDTALTEEQMDHVLAYMDNDLQNTELIFWGVLEALEMRWEASKEYGINLMSKSDAQMGEAIIKKRVEQETGERIVKGEVVGGYTFKYPVPTYLAYERDDLRSMIDRLRETEFLVQHDGKVGLPDWLAHMKVTIGETTYQMGIGGLHSTESNRSIHGDEEYFCQDSDVQAYYPAIILNSGLYPKALGPKFLEVYRKIRDERVVAKQTGDKVKDQGLKIALNGCFGKLGSPYSVLYAPHLMIAVTLTGQLALLMLIERAEAAGIQVVSGNTDGVVFRCLHDRQGELRAITRQWEAETGFVLEDTRYRSLYNASVNSYIAVKEDGKAKLKGPIANPWRSGGDWKPDLRGQLMKNPQATILCDAVVDLILHDTPVEETIRASRDIRDFVTVVKVEGGGTWRGEYLGKVVRYIWARGGEEILKAKPHATTGNYAKVPKSDGCRPIMDLPDSFPDDIDYDAYVAAAHEILMDLGYTDRPPPIKPLRIYKYNAILWFAIAV
jgi:hypothetical protein